MNLNYALIGTRIRLYREIKGLSQEEIADRVHVTERHIRSIETGTKGASLSLMIELANVLETTVDELLRDYLTDEKATLKFEMFDILNGSTPIEQAILLDMLKHMKALLSEHGI